jgi:hypothetical protein
LKSWLLDPGTLILRVQQGFLLEGRYCRKVVLVVESVPKVEVWIVMDDGHACQVRHLIILPARHSSGELRPSSHEPCVAKLFVIKPPVDFIELGLDPEKGRVTLPPLASTELGTRRLSWVDRVAYL